MAPPFPPDDERLRAVRAALPAVGAGIYLDTATAGPLPAETAAVMAELAEWEVRTGRASEAFREEATARLDECRAAVAAILTADVDEIALASSAGGAVAAALAEIPFRPGDVIATVAPVHAPALAPARRLARALGLRVVEIPLEPEVPPVVEAVERATVEGPLRLVALPHVSTATGRRLDVAAIAEVGHAVGASVLVDGSQAAGALRVDVPSLGVDAYAVAGETWLLGPGGTGALWVAGERPATRLDTDAWYRPAVVGLARSIGWLSMYVGLDWLQSRAVGLATALLERLDAIDGVDTLTVRDELATIVAFRIAGWHADEALAELAARTFLLARAVTEVDAIRLSVAGFTGADELERLLAAVELLAGHRPGTLPARRTLTILDEASS
ncbi:MAG TPA: aminotransferase class V-fold PLP-dependent enzyme [Candidatus Dormibacteraeota bacterium]|nr:aminotransferase class V-fold PLP-dependent enzyme [Candidatus Dormibacteraeota bacterium]